MQDFEQSDSALASIEPDSATNASLNKIYDAQQILQDFESANSMNIGTLSRVSTPELEPEFDPEKLEMQAEDCFQNESNSSQSKLFSNYWLRMFQLCKSSIDIILQGNFNPKIKPVCLDVYLSGNYWDGIGLG